MGKGAGEKNGAKKSEPARELLLFEFPALADERSDLIGYFSSPHSSRRVRRFSVLCPLPKQVSLLAG